jgi:hypothetical protein
MPKKIREEELGMLESGIEGQPITRVQALENELKELEAEKKMLEIEKGMHHLMEEMHPSKRAKAASLLKKAIGGVRSTPESRTKRRDAIGKGVGEVVRFLKERKAQKEAGFKLPAKYYENVLGRGWVAGEKPERKHIRHRKRHMTARKRRKAKYRAMYSPFEYEPRERYYEPETYPRRRIVEVRR